jgi:release factor glutamine methyltransferase
MTPPAPGPQTVTELLALGERVLVDSTHIFEDHDHRREAEDLLAFALGEEPANLRDGLRPTRRQSERYLSLIARRAAGEPFPFLTGKIEFWGLELDVRPGAFVPRPSSELVVERALKRLASRKAPTVVDVCTGAGPIALAIADEKPAAEVWGADISTEGLRQARRNAKALDVENVRFEAGDMYDSLPRRLLGSVDVITGHVPYVPPDEVLDLPSEVREHEPLYTLSDNADDDGLWLMRRAIGGAPRWLKPGGWLLLEVSEDMTRKLRKLCRAAGLVDKGAVTDEDHLSMVVEAQKSRSRASPAR